MTPLSYNGIVSTATQIVVALGPLLVVSIAAVAFLTFAFFMKAFLSGGNSSGRGGAGGAQSAGAAVSKRLKGYASSRKSSKS